MIFRGMKLVKYTFAVMLLLASCSSPESDGKNLGEEYNDNIESYVSKTMKAYNNFINEFGDNNFQTRVAAREALNEKLEKISNEYSANCEKIENKYNSLLGKYENDYQKAASLINAYSGSVKSHKVDSTMIAELRTRANKKILTIIPPQPIEEKLRNDLVGRSIHAIPGGYFSDSWVWNIEKDEIKELKILEVSNVDSHNKEYVVDMTLQSEGAPYNVNLKMFYKLADQDDWEIDMIEPAEINIVKSGRYDNSIIASIEKPLIGTYLILKNVSDGALIVGYRILDYHGNWTKYSRVVAGGETEQHGLIGYEDYKIDFIERP